MVQKSRAFSIVIRSPLYTLFKGRNVHTFSQPSGGSRAKNRLMRGDAPVPELEAPSSGDVLWLSSAEDNETMQRIINIKHISIIAVTIQIE